jgi:hypothetical protein
VVVVRNIGQGEGKVVEFPGVEPKVENRSPIAVTVRATSTARKALLGGVLVEVVLKLEEHT